MGNTLSCKVVTAITKSSFCSPVSKMRQLKLITSRHFPPSTTQQQRGIHSNRSIRSIVSEGARFLDLHWLIHEANSAFPISREIANIQPRQSSLVARSIT